MTKTTGINEDLYKRVLSDLNSEITTAKNETKNRRAFLEISSEQFRQLFILNMNLIFSKKGHEKNYMFDENNSEIISQIYFYLVGSKQFKGDLNKGIMLSGSIGAGKTMIINGIINIIEALSTKRFIRTHAKRLTTVIKENSPDFLDKRPLFVDDIGKEEKTVNDFGTKINPVPDLFSIRYDNSAWTFTTCNYQDDTLAEMYGETIVDRFSEMFNVMILKGYSRRNKNIITCEIEIMDNLEVFDENGKH